MKKNTLVVITRDQAYFKEKLNDLKLPNLKIIVPEDPSNAYDDVAKATILFAIPSMVSKYINHAKNAVWMQSIFVGIDAMNEPGLRKDYLLTNVHNELYGELITEYVFSYILLFEKENIENLAYQKQGIWHQKDARPLRNKVICILGTGSIGKNVARVAKAFNMRTLGYRNKNEPLEYFDEIFTRGNFKNCLAQADYVVTVLPCTKETDDIINNKTLSYMKNTAVLFNVGRGNAVNENDLVEAIKEKKIAKAVLDVFKKEPLPKESPLWDTEGIYITAHQSGFMVNDKIMDIFAENYRRFINDEELLHKIDFEKGY